MADRNSINIQELREAILYNPETGALTWVEEAPSWYPPNIRSGWKTRFAGKPALASRHVHGYGSGMFQRVCLRAHQAAWAIYYGEFPEVIDHIDGDPTNNAIKNLRATTQSKNAWNRRKRCDSAANYIGVRKVDRPRIGYPAWMASIEYKREKVYLGLFATEEDAARAYDAANWARAGQFARLNFPEVQHDEAKAGDWDGFVNEFRRMRESKSAAA